MIRPLLSITVATALLAGCGRDDRRRHTVEAADASPATSERRPPDPVNYGGRKPAAKKPFAETTVAMFNLPWAMTFLPDRRMLVTEKPGNLWLVTPDGEKTPVKGVPDVHFEGQGGLLFVVASPDHATDHRVYLTYSEPGEGGDGLALARATLDERSGRPLLTGLEVIWRQLPRGSGGQFGGYIAFSPDRRFLFLTVGERERFTPAQDPNQALGKILRLTLDGKPAAGNPHAGDVGMTRVGVIDPADNSTGAARMPKRWASTSSPNVTPSEIWSSGHRNSYGLAFDDAGRLWETEMGPKGGDELNLVVAGHNYGWPAVSYGSNYDDTSIASPDTRPEFAKPALYWNPVIAPAGLAFYRGDLFPSWRGSAFVGGLGARTLVRITFGNGTPGEAERWDMAARIRFVATGPDGAIWLLEDDQKGRLRRLTPR